MIQQPSIPDVAAKLVSMSEEVNAFVSKLRAEDKEQWVRLEVIANRVLDDARNALWSAYYHLDAAKRLAEVTDAALRPVTDS